MNDLEEGEDERGGGPWDLVSELAGKPASWMGWRGSDGVRDGGRLIEGF